jgi:hypothetical protein
LTPEGVERLTAQADARPALWPLAASTADSHCRWSASPSDGARCEPRAPLPRGTRASCLPLLFAAALAMAPAAPAETGTTGMGGPLLFAVLLVRLLRNLS